MRSRQTRKKSRHYLLNIPIENKKEKKRKRMSVYLLLLLDLDLDRDLDRAAGFLRGVGDDATDAVDRLLEEPDLPNR